MTKFEPQTANCTNAKLLAAFTEWEQNSHFMDVASKNNLSRPYVCSVSDKYYEVEEAGNCSQRRWKKSAVG